MAMGLGCDLNGFTPSWNKRTIAARWRVISGSLNAYMLSCNPKCGGYLHTSDPRRLFSLFTRDLKPCFFLLPPSCLSNSASCRVCKWAVKCSVICFVAAWFKMESQSIKGACNIYSSKILATQFLNAAHGSWIFPWRTVTDGFAGAPLCKTP